jgi:hypothetical protein
VRASARLGVLVALAGCVPRSPIPPLPSQGGPAWHELASPHFTLWTDASVDRGRALIVRMEHHRQIVLKALADPPAPARIFVVALRDGDEVAAYITHQFAAMAFSVGNPALQPAVIVAADTGENRDHDQILTHELTHAITYAFLPQQPAWFAEGLANYFATARLYPDHKQFDLGYPIDWMARDLLQHHPEPFAQLLACTHGPCLDSRFYATAWAAFSFLVNNHRTELFALIDHLAKLPPDVARDDPARSWAEAVPALPPALLDEQLAQWVAYGKVGVSQFDIDLVDPDVKERLLTEADALAARAWLRHGDGPELAQALALDPTNLLARLVQAGQAGPAGSTAVPVEVAHAIATAHPTDWRAWYLVVRAAPGDADAWTQLCGLGVGLAPKPILEHCRRG